MPSRTLGFGTLPALTLVAACATAVDQGFVDDGSHSGSGGSLQGGASSQAGSKASAGNKASAGGQPSAFGGSSASVSGAGGAGQAGSGIAGSAGSGNQGGAHSAGSPATGGGGMTSAGSGGSSAGSGGSSAGSGGSSAGSGGSSGSTGSTGDCAPAGSGWVVQYWTNTPAANMPAGDLRIFNNSGGTVNFTTLELRHYFTNEETASLSFIFSTFGHDLPASPYYEDEGGANVLSSIAAVAPAVTNASHYISIKFNDKPGSFGNDESVKLGYYGSLSMYPLKSNQANDYTYIGHPTSDPGSSNKTTGWDRITLYQAGKLVWGCEP